MTGEERILAKDHIELFSDFNGPLYVRPDRPPENVKATFEEWRRLC